MVLVSPALSKALNDGDLRGVEVALATDDVNDRFLIPGMTSGMTMLHYVMAGTGAPNYSWTHAHDEIVRLLLARGADPNLTCDFSEEMGGITALHAVVRQHDAAHLFELLVAHGAQVDAQNSIGMTPLMLAVTMKSHEAIRALLRLGANIDLVDGGGSDALMMARADPGFGFRDNNGAIQHYVPDPKIVALLSAVRAAGSWKRYCREPAVKLLALRYLSLAGRATPPAHFSRLFGTPPVQVEAQQRPRRGASRTLPDGVFKNILAFWNESEP